jgi:peptidoglycan/LPS O-acetylase OafA/YrhL
MLSPTGEKRSISNGHYPSINIVSDSTSPPAKKSTHNTDNSNTTTQDKPSSLSSKLDWVAVDGLRGVCCTFVIFFHVMMYWGQVIDQQTGYSILYKWPMKALQSGPMGPEIFFLLTGIWATLQLVPLLEKAVPSSSSSYRRQKGELDGKTTTETITTYYRKRLLYKLLPPYFTTMLLIAFTIPHDHENIPPLLVNNHNTVFEYCHLSLPLNFVFLNNFFGFGGCGTQYWSLAAQIHFYLCFPLLLVALKPKKQGFRRRLAITLTVCIAAVTAVRLALALIFNMKLPLLAWPHSDASPHMLAHLVDYFHWIYFPTTQRLISFLVGSLFALYTISPGGMMKSRLYKPPFAAALASISVLAVYWYLCIRSTRIWGYHQHDNNDDNNLYDAVYIALAHHGSPLASLTALALVVLIATHSTDGSGRGMIIGSILASMLKLPMMKKLSDLSYHMYLLHMPVAYWLEAALLRYVPFYYLRTARGTTTTATTTSTALSVAAEEYPLLTFAVMGVSVYVVTLMAALGHQAYHSWMNTVIGRMFGRREIGEKKHK